MVHPLSLVLLLMMPAQLATYYWFEHMTQYSTTPFEVTTVTDFQSTPPHKSTIQRLEAQKSTPKSSCSFSLHQKGFYFVFKPETLTLETTAAPLQNETTLSPPTQDFISDETAATFSPLTHGFNTSETEATFSPLTNGFNTSETEETFFPATHGFNTSETDGPTNVSVSVSPSGEIVEGSSVTLTCYSLSYLTMNYSWFSGTTLIGTGQSYRIDRIRAEDRGEYMCQASNTHGEANATLTLSVSYSPKRVLLSSRPFSGILEGTSVTLTCSSDANPPVESYTWFKRSGAEDLQIGTGQSYSITHISIEDSYKFKCRASNQHGSAFSEYTALDILYGPKRVLVSSRPSGGILEGASVTLTCSSDANPPVKSYTWFKRSGTSDLQIGTGQSYSITHISIEDSYKYKCRTANRHGSALSEYTALDILYGPKTVLVSSSSSGGILEGTSVTLTCSSDANPPVESYTWFKRSGTVDLQLGYGQNYSIKNISIKDSYKYKCRASNRHRSAFSEYTTLDILYGPKRVLVSSSPSGGIIEGRSATLTCSSEANPPVESYTWFKRSGTRDLQIGYGQSYSIKNISSEDSYKYKCRASNQHGSAFSEYTALDVLYSPKKTSVLVTLTCNTDANPPVMDYTWYKEGESEPVAYGQTYSIASITKEDIAPFYCKAGNRIGHDFARPVPVTCIEECPKAQVAAVGIGGFFGGLIVAVLFTILWLRRKNQTTSGSEYEVESRRKKQKKTAVEVDYENVSPDTKDDTYTALNLKTKTSDDVYEALTTESSPPCAVTQV